MAPPNLLDYIKPLEFDIEQVSKLSDGFLEVFKQLSANSREQFLPTPISDSILRPVSRTGQGRYLAIDIGGTNLRVAFVELLSGEVKRLIEKSWPIDEQLKSGNTDSLFHWIGTCIAQVVEDGCKNLGIPRDKPLPLGVTFSFPMEQHSLSEATLMSMGKGFAVTSNLDLGALLLKGYDAAKSDSLPRVYIAAIANDSVSTLVSFIYKYEDVPHRRAAMGLIAGTGCNATVPLKLSRLHPSKRPQNISVLPGENMDDVKITLNTEWSINGSAPPLRKQGWINKWDEILDSQNETPGFQPLEYMTAGRYLGELGRIMILDYIHSILDIKNDVLPPKLLQRHGMTTAFLSKFKPLDKTQLLAQLRLEFPGGQGFSWTEELAEVLYRMAKAIEVRAAGIVAAATVALLVLAEELPPAASIPGANEPRELGVGYTGGCIEHFHEYLEDCQGLIDKLVERRLTSEPGRAPPLKVVLSPCRDGGIVGAGILAAAALQSENAEI